MSLDLVAVLVAAAAVSFSLGLTVGSARLEFYRAYFRQKQINAGRDPDAVLKENFPVAWRILR